MSLSTTCNTVCCAPRLQTTSAPLSSEWLKACRLNERSHVWLIRQGVTAKSLRWAPTAVAIQWVAMRGGLFVPDPQGFRAFVMPVWDRHPLLGGMIVDLVAWQPSRPTVWWLRTGWGVALGEWWAVDANAFPGFPLFQPTPLDWLRAGGAGICRLIREPDARAQSSDRQWSAVS